MRIDVLERKGPCEKTGAAGQKTTGATSALWPCLIQSSVSSLGVAAAQVVEESSGDWRDWRVGCELPRYSVRVQGTERQIGLESASMPIACSNCAC